MPVQESGTRISRALPYEFLVSDQIASSSDATSSITFQVQNTGTTGAAFTNFDITHLSTVKPRPYTVEAGKNISDMLVLSAATGGEYAYSLLGPNGFVRELYGLYR